MGRKGKLIIIVTKCIFSNQTQRCFKGTASQEQGSGSAEGRKKITDSYAVCISKYNYLRMKIQDI